MILICTKLENHNSTSHFRITHWNLHSQRLNAIFKAIELVKGSQHPAYRIPLLPYRAGHLKREKSHWGPIQCPYHGGAPVIRVLCPFSD